jgi:ureidoacrylate peracid hydrolase
MISKTARGNCAGQLRRISLLITIPAKPNPIQIKSDKTALVVVDMQNAFCTKGGLFDSLGKLDEARLRPLISRLRKVIDLTRGAGIKIIYLTMGYRPDLADAGGPDSPNYWKEGSLAFLREHSDPGGKPLVAGTWDARVIDELAPRAADLVVNKNRYSGFANTGLDGILRDLSIQYLIFAGVFTNVCVESTIRDAYFQEYFPLLIGDGCTNVGPAFTQEATLWTVSNVFGWVTSSNEFIEALTSTD